MDLCKKIVSATERRTAFPFRSILRQIVQNPTNFHPLKET